LEQLVFIITEGAKAVASGVELVAAGDATVALGVAWVLEAVERIEVVRVLEVVEKVEVVDLVGEAHSTQTMICLLPMRTKNVIQQAKHSPQYLEGGSCGGE